MTKCPKCGKEAKKVSYLGICCVACQNCGFDEREIYEVYPEEKTSQKAKGRYSPYKAGGPKRAGKIKK